MEDKGYSVKIIERDKQRAEDIATGLNKSVVLNGDAADTDLLLQENVESTRRFYRGHRER